MKVTFEPKAEYVTVTIEDDTDARKFCLLALEAVMGDEDPPDDMKKIYNGYADQMADSNTAHWDRGLWDFVVQRHNIGGVKLEITFGQKLMQLLCLV